MHYSLIKLDHADWDALLRNVTTDAGKGSVYAGLFNEFLSLDCVNESSSCNTCAQDTLSLMRVNPVTKCCGVSGVKNFNSTQLLFTKRV